MFLVNIGPVIRLKLYKHIPRQKIMWHDKYFKDGLDIL